MKSNRRNHGFTLVELLVVILVGSIVTLAGTTVLLMGLRMNRQSTDTASGQITARMVLMVLENMAAEEEIQVVDSGDSWEVQKKDGSVLYAFNASESAIYVGSNTDSPLMTEVTATVEWDSVLDNLLVLSITTEDGTYESKIYCRLIQETETEETEGPAVTPAEASATAFSHVDIAEEDLTPDLTDVDHAEAREAFLAVLASEEGSIGCSLTTGEYFSEWYIGSYEDNPEWNEETPWCACFVSWALEQCGEYLNEVPKFAHVDKFMRSFGIGSWKTQNPKPGDIIFFDWIENEMSYPQHVGVVVNVKDNFVYTIEGNADGQVSYRRYALDDAYIIGYGVLDWK